MGSGRRIKVGTHNASGAVSRRQRQEVWGLGAITSVFGGVLHIKTDSGKKCVGQQGALICGR